MVGRQIGMPSIVPNELLDQVFQLKIFFHLLLTVSRILKKGKELLTQTSACVCCRIGHFLKLSKSSCPSCIEFLYQHSHCPLKGILEYFCSLLVTFVNYVVLSFTAEI